MIRSAAIRRTLAGLLLAFAGLSLAWTVLKEVRSRRGGAGGGEVAGTDLTVYYFHATARCQTCKRIEELTRRVVAEEFAAEVAAGRIEFRTLNREEPANAAVVERYALATNAVVLVRGGDGGRWEDLRKIWDLVWDEPAFRKYVSSAISAMLEAE
jgi:predicted oxidoreductase